MFKFSMIRREAALGMLSQAETDLGVRETEERGEVILCCLRGGDEHPESSEIRLEGVAKLGSQCCIGIEPL